MDSDKVKHGTSRAYNYHKCRCPECRKAKRLEMRKYRMGDDAIYMADEAHEPTPLEHGDRGMYTKMKCRCPECTKANRDYQREYMRKRRQRLRATDVESRVEDDSNDDDTQLRF